MSSKCMLCPRMCSVDRKGTVGFCGMKDTLKAARCAPHFWEEPPISGKRGSGAIFFSGCNLRCVYCQNFKISSGGFGKEISDEKLEELMLSLQNRGVHNINLVTPTHFAGRICRVLDKIKPKLYIPVIYNCGGYESEETLKNLNGLIDIYLPDFKYKSEEAAVRLSRAPHYFEIASKALETMVKQVGKPRITDGIMQSGVIVRHMVLPGFSRDSLEILKYLDSAYEKGEILLSLMSQYTPQNNCADKKLARRVTSFEYGRAADFALKCGFKGFFQERSSAKTTYTPDFDLSGI